MTQTGAHPPMLKESEDQITIIEHGLCFENCARDTCTRLKKLPTAYTLRWFHVWRW